MSGAGDVLGRAVLVLDTDGGPLSAGLDGAKDKLQSTAGVFGKVGSSLGSGLATAAKTAAIGLAVVGGAAVAMGYSCVQAAAESQQVMAQTEAVIASTGGAAGLSADQVADLAGQLSQVTPIDDEVIQSAENVLLTFTNISGDVMPKATETVLDMATALGTDTQSAAIQLGKALNDPIKGITALTKVGVNFTDEQKEQIKTMVEAGDVAGAQAVIMNELGKEFGGSARAAGKTFAGQLAILKTQLGNVQEEIGARLLPIVSVAVGWFAARLPGAIDVVMRVLDSLIDKLAGPLSAAFSFIRDGVLTFVQALQGDWVSASGINPVHDAIGRIALVIRNEIVPAITSLAGWITGTLVPTLLSIASTVISNVLPVIRQFASWFTGEALPAIQNFATTVVSFITGQVVPAFLGFVNAVQPPLMEVLSFLDGNLKAVFVGVGAIIVTIFAAWAISAAAAAVATIAALLPVIAVLAAIGVAAALLYAAWESNFLNIQGIVSTVLDVLQTTFETVFPIIQTIVETTLTVIQAVFETVWPIIQAATEFAFNAIATAVTTYIAIAQAIIETVLPIIQSVFETVWPIAQSAVELAMAGVVTAVDLIHGVYDTVSSVLSSIQTAFETVWQACVTAVETAWDSIVTAVETINDVYETISGVLDDIKQYFSDAWDDVVTTVETGVDNVIDAVADLPGRAISALGDLSSTLRNAGRDLIQGFIDGVTSMLPDLDGVLGGITDHIPDIKGPPARDRMLLYDSGVMVMQGFNNGLLDGFETVTDTLTGFTTLIGKWSPVAGTGGGGGVPAGLEGVDVGPVLKSEGPGIAQYCVGDVLVFSDGHGEKGHPACQPGGKFYTGNAGSSAPALSNVASSSSYSATSSASSNALASSVGMAVRSAFSQELAGFDDRLRRAVVAGIKQAGSGAF